MIFRRTVLWRMPSSFSNSQSSACMRGSSPCQKEQKGSSESFCVQAVFARGAPDPRAAGGGSYTRSTSQSEQRVNPAGTPLCIGGRTWLNGVYYTKKYFHTCQRLRCYTVCSTPYFLLLAKSFETGCKLPYLNTLFVTRQIYIL